MEHDKHHDQMHERSKAHVPPAEAPCKGAPPLAGMEPTEATDVQPQSLKPFEHYLLLILLLQLLSQQLQLHKGLNVPKKLQLLL